MKVGIKIFFVKDHDTPAEGSVRNPTVSTTCAAAPDASSLTERNPDTSSDSKQSKVYLTSTPPSHDPHDPHCLHTTQNPHCQDKRSDGNPENTKTSDKKICLGPKNPCVNVEMQRKW